MPSAGYSQRIVSLLPSATEIVAALGLTDRLVGVSHDCDYPPEAVRGRPVLSAAAVRPDLPSPEIDAQIRGQVHRGLSVYHLEERLLARLRPDLILTQELCRVCAPSYTLVREAAKVLEGQPRIVSLEPESLDGVLETILLVGGYGGRQEAAAALVGDLRRRIARVRSQVTGLPRPRVVCLEWLDPLFAAGHWIPEMVTLAGGEDPLGTAGAPSFPVEWEAVLAAAPDVLVLMPCGFDIARTRAEAHLLITRPGWAALPAVYAGRVYLTDASAYFSRPGPRIVTGLEILAAALHPDRISLDLPPDALERL